MKVFFDTSVLVAASEQGHPHYGQAWSALRRVINRKDQGFISVHSIAEVYAVLTRLPVQPCIHPAEAVRIISDNILPHFETVPVGKEGSHRGSQAGWRRGIGRSKDIRRVAHRLRGEIRR